MDVLTHINKPTGVAAVVNEHEEQIINRHGNHAGLQCRLPARKYPHSQWLKNEWPMMNQTMPGGYIAQLQVRVSG